MVRAVLDLEEPYYKILRRPYSSLIDLSPTPFVMDSWIFSREPVQLGPALLLINAQKQIVQTSIYKPYRNPTYFQDPQLNAFIYDSHTQSYHLNSGNYQIIYTTPKQAVLERELIRLLEPFEKAGVQLHQRDEQSCKELAKCFGIPEGSVPLYLVLFHAYHDSIFVHKDESESGSCSLYDFLIKRRGETIYPYLRKISVCLFLLARPDANLSHSCKAENVVNCGGSVIFCTICCMLRVPLPTASDGISRYKQEVLGKVVLPENIMIEFIKQVEEGVKGKQLSTGADLETFVFPYVEKLLKTKLVSAFPSINPHIIMAVLMRYCVFMAATKRTPIRSWEDVQKDRNERKKTNAEGLLAVLTLTRVGLKIAGLSIN